MKLLCLRLDHTIQTIGGMQNENKINRLVARDNMLNPSSGYSFMKGNSQSPQITFSDALP